MVLKIEKKTNSSLFNLGSTSREMPSVWELRRKGGFKEKTDHSSKESDGQHLASLWLH
jgi:hypothetical protein